MYFYALKIQYVILSDLLCTVVRHSHNIMQLDAKAAAAYPYFKAPHCKASHLRRKPEKAIALHSQRAGNGDILSAVKLMPAPLRRQNYL